MRFSKNIKSNGYISHKYVQFLPLTNISKNDLTDKSLSVTYLTNSTLSIEKDSLIRRRQIVGIKYKKRRKK